MTALPKRKISTRRKGKRRLNKKISLPTLTNCKTCKQPRKSHTICKYCKK